MNYVIHNAFLDFAIPKYILDQITSNAFSNYVIWSCILDCIFQNILGLCNLKAYSKLYNSKFLFYYTIQKFIPIYVIQNTFSGQEISSKFVIIFLLCNLSFYLGLSRINHILCISISCLRVIFILNQCNFILNFCKLAN